MTQTGRELLDGVVVPVITAMDSDRMPQASGMETLLRALANAGIRKIMIFGSNGEGPVLGQAELGPFAREVADTWRELVPGGMLFVNVSGSSTDDSLRRAHAILPAEPDAIVVSPPMYYRHSTQDIVVHYRAFVDLGAPIVAYNSPAYTGNDLTLDLTRQLLELDHVVGMKDSSKVEGRILGLVEVAGARPGFGVSQGDEAALSQGLADGASGITPGIANLAPVLAIDLFTASRNGDTARAAELQRTITQLTGIHAIRPGIATTKAALKLRGVCEGYVSRPFSDYTHEGLEALREFLMPWDLHLIGAAGTV